MSVRLACCIVLALCPPLAFAEPAAGGAPLLEMSLEELGRLQVTGTSRTTTALTETPASVFVIRGDEIRSLGIRTLPEALRLAPNLHVAQINASSHAVSARGMKTSLSNKLLVLVDGRPIYTPLFAGVLWDQQRVPMDEIDRIEVVSGPGAAAWGANAVNGVINIVTLPARADGGGAAHAWAAEDGHGVSVRQHFATGADAALRVYAQRDRHDASRSPAGDALPDGWTQSQAGFRADWRRGENGFELHGDIARARSDRRAFGAIEVDAYNLAGSWTHRTASGGEWRVTAYHDVVDRLDPQVIDDRMTIDAIELVHDSVHGSHHLTWGAGYRHARDDSSPGALARLVPDDRTMGWAHAFVQDHIAIGARLNADLGLRLDDGPFTGVEVLPTLRLSYRGERGSLLWGALSRAVRAPARFDRDFHFPASEPFIIRGGPDFESEVSNVAELGFRAQPTARLSLSVTAFHHWHDGLRGGEPAPGGGVVISNRVEGRTWGAEGWLTLREPGDWEVAAGFLELRHSLQLMPGFPDASAVRDQGNDPEHQLLLRATKRFAASQQVSLFARHVSALPAPRIDAYTQLDARWSIGFGDAVELGIGVRNLFDERHVELQPSGGLAPSEFGRSAHVDLAVEW